MAVIHPTPQFISDLSGDSVDVQTVSFALNGTATEIDLTGAEYDTLAALLHPYIENGRRASIDLNTPKRSRSSNGNGRGASDAKQIREWARTQGVEVPSKGRIPAAVREQYTTALVG
jgi:hypothetical protein